jgi:hypothetical protein
MDRRRIAGKLPWLVAAVAALASAPADAAERAELELRLTTDAPAAPSGLELRVLYRHPDDAERKPPQIRALKVALPEGTVLDDGALPRCEASDEQLRLLGRRACPAASELGRGSLTAVSGLGPPFDPLAGDVTVFNGRGELIELVTLPGTDVAAGFDRLRLDGATLEGHPPATPGGPPDGQTTIREVRFALAPAGTPERPYLRTPPHCPASRTWTSRGEFAFADGGSASVEAPSPCVRAVAPRAGAAPALRVHPRRVRAGSPTRFRLRLVNVPERCRSGATARIAGRRARTDASGRATIRATLRRAGRVRVRALRRGCPRVSALVRVLPRRG